jgi:HEAT repeat protein
VKYKDKSALPKLIEVMRKDENPSARANAAWALSKHGDKSAAQPFLEALEDPESWVRLYAVSGVKRLRVKRAIPTLRLLLSDKSDLVARKAKDAIKSLGGR